MDRGFAREPQTPNAGRRRQTADMSPANSNPAAKLTKTWSLDLSRNCCCTGIEPLLSMCSLQSPIRYGSQHTNNGFRITQSMESESECPLSINCASIFDLLTDRSVIRSGQCFALGGSQSGLNNGVGSASPIFSHRNPTTVE